MRTHTYLFVTLLLIAPTVGLAQTLPKSTGRVNDFANIIPPEVESELDAQIASLENTTSHEVAVVTVESLGGTTVEDYANRLFKEWGIGQAQKDNGVLILVAPNERDVRIEVGYGLEGILPDGLAGKVIRDDILPHFKENDYPGGIRAGTLKVIDIVAKQQVLTPEEIEKLNNVNSTGAVFAIVAFLGVFVAIGALMTGIGIRTKTAFGPIFGIFFGGLPILLAVSITKIAYFTLVPFGIGMFVFGYRLGARKGVRDAFRTGKGAKSGGWTMGASSSGGGSSRSGGSSSSFGGGSSGGGGASGKW